MQAIHREAMQRGAKRGLQKYAQKSLRILTKVNNGGLKFSKEPTAHFDYFAWLTDLFMHIKVKRRKKNY